MRKLWAFFSSIWLTIALAALICADAAFGSIIAIRHPEFFRALDQMVLFPAILSGFGTGTSLTLWVYILIFLTFLFAVNTFVCTADRVYSIIKTGGQWRSFFPHIVHIGFLVALLGHLAGSVWGFRSYGNVLFPGEAVPVPHMEGLSMRLDGFEMKPAPGADLESLKTTITLLRDGARVLTDDIQINGPVIYKGTAFYHADQGRMPNGLVLDIDGQTAEVRFNSPAKLSNGASLTLGEIYPDFALDEKGVPISRSNEFINPHMEVIYTEASGARARAFLDISRAGGEASIDGKRLRLIDLMISPYVVLTINKDPGIWLIIAGSAVLTAGMALLLFFRGERSELVRPRRP